MYIKSVREYVTTFTSIEQFGEYPYCVEFAYQGPEARMRNYLWLARTFGLLGSWHASIYHGGYYFRREQDLTLFRLWAS